MKRGDESENPNKILNWWPAGKEAFPTLAGPSRFFVVALCAVGFTDSH
jgi:hypothetical protein